MISIKKSITSLIGTVILLSLFQPFGVSATEVIDETNNIEEVQNEINKYISNNNGNVTFDIEQARKDKQSDFIIEIGKKVNEIDSAYQDDTSTYGLSIPIWGNWCGPGYGGGPTKGLLDQACKMHDKDYARYGYFDCASDARLINRINTHYSRMGTSEKVAANGVKAYFIAQMNVRGCIGYL